jgi:hypothetical protein
MHDAGARADQAAYVGLVADGGDPPIAHSHGGGPAALAEAAPGTGKDKIGGISGHG